QGAPRAPLAPGPRADPHLRTGRESVPGRPGAGLQPAGESHRPAAGDNDLHPGDAGRNGRVARGKDPHGGRGSRGGPPPGPGPETGPHAGGILMKVYLIGAGPGDPGLITLKACRILRLCDVIVYDDLIPRAILSLVRPDAETMYVGKR